MIVYGAVAAGIVWLGALPWLLVRALRGQVRSGEWRERLAWAPVPALGHRPLLIHAVSAGEMVAARALVDALVRLDPDVRIALTTGTSDGRVLAERWRVEVPQVTWVGFLPWDRPRAIRRWLGRLQPAAVSVVEAELWPGLFRACRDVHIPLFVVSGRLGARDVSRYRWLGGWWRSIMRLPTRVLAQDAEQADAFVAIGVPADRVDVGGNLKFDAAAPSIHGRDDAVFSIVAGSTHAPEELWILEAVARLQRAGVSCRLMIAPRDVRRAHAVRQQVIAAGVAAVTVLDRMGTLPAAYASAHVAIAGGTCAPVGGHNIIEPAAVGCAIVTGPHVAHVRGLVASLCASGGAIALDARAVPSTALYEVLQRLQRDRVACEALGRRAVAWCAAQRGAARQAAVMIAGATPARR
jgi:3-deoxy-D-manno-octulosonic-acid transferase